MNGIKESCGNCSFSFPTQEHPDMVLCRRYPPPVVYCGQMALQPKMANVQILFPQMKKFGWCGEWKLKTEGNA